MTKFLAGVREMKWFGRERAVSYGLILLAVETAILIWIAAKYHGLFGPVPATSTDFLAFYAAGTLANQGAAPAIYDFPTLRAMELAIYGGTDQSATSFVFPYPPIFVLICCLLARMPYLVAFYAWAGGQVILYLASIRALLKDWGIAWAMLSCPALMLNVIIGHNAGLTAIFLATGTLLLERRPVLAGVALGALCYKPHFILMAPIALVAGGGWRALASTLLTGLALAGLSVFLFGVACWTSFFHVATLMRPVYEDVSGQWAFASLLSGVRVLGGGVATAYIVQILGAITAGTLVGWAWYRRWPVAVRSAMLVAATMIAAPVIMSYDLIMATVAMAWLAVDARETGWLGWEKLSFVTIWVVMLVGRGIAEKAGIPLMPLIGPCLALLALRRGASPHLQRICTSASAR